MISTQDSGHRTQDFLGALVVLVSRIVTAPITPWESDEMLFASAVRAWDPSRYHPHPPGYPLLVILGKAANAMVGDPWRALLIVNIIAAPLGFIALSRLFRRLTGDAALSLCGAFLFYFSAAMLVHGTLAMSDGVSVALAIAALLGVAKIDDGESPAFAAVFASLAIGCRPQLLLPLIPVLLYALIRIRTTRQRLLAIAVFTAVSLLWFVPLVVAAGGPHALLAYETKQAQYVAAHDAATSRAPFSATALALRFLVHPWGAKLITIPLLLIAATGIVPTWRRRGAVLPIALFTAVYVWFELQWMDPADAARYDLPAMMFVALLVALGLGTIRDWVKLRATPYAITLALAALSLDYVSPILIVRHTTASAPAASAAYIRANFPPNAVVLADGVMRQDAEYLLPDRETLPANDGLRKYYDRPEVPLVRWENGSSRMAAARVFSWPPSDAYGKLTRKLYLSAVVEPIPPAERFMPVVGVYGPERNNEGEEWRWLSREATLRLPHAHGSTAAFHLLLPVAAPDPSLDVQLFVNGVTAARATLHRGRPATVVVATLPGDCVIRIVASRAYVPNQIVQNGDTRVLSAQLLAVVQR